MPLPITQKQAYTVAEWIKSNFRSAIDKAVKGTPFSTDILCGIACQESAYFWLPLLKRLSAKEILARCVLDANGDYPGTKRSAFPANTAAFRNQYGDEFANMLISEANATRKLRGFGPQQWVYKGYGLFQYDLQSVKTDEAFFRERKWYDFDECLNRVMKELAAKYKAQKDLWKAVRAYNGSGAGAARYVNNVGQFASYSGEVA